MSAESGVMVATCACGFKVRYGDRHIGRTVKCKICEASLTLSPPIKIDDEYKLEEPDIKFPDARPLEERTTRKTEIHASEATRTSPILLDREARLAQRRENGFWKDAFGAFAFAKNPDSLVKSIILVVAFVVTDLIPGIGALLGLGVTGLAYGFFFSIVQNSAGGDDDLPDPLEIDGLFDSVIVPLFSVFVITTGLALLPFAVTFGLPGNTPALAISVGVSIFLWPAIVLLVALGDFWMGFRIDLALRTILSAFVPYLFIWLMIGIAGAAQVLASGAGESWIPDAVLSTNPLVLLFTSRVMSVFFMIISMKIIGLYYRHYSDRFPWSAG